MAIGVQDKSRLHCCGVHHHASDRPQGVTLLLSDDHDPPEFQAACYGTGDNPDSVILLYPSHDLPYQSTKTQVLADELARGANVTVLIPHYHQSDASDHADAAQSSSAGNAVVRMDTPDNRQALETFLRNNMKVQFIGVLATSDDMGRKLDCIVTLMPRSEQAENVPTLYLTQSAAQESTLIQEEPVLVKQCSYIQSPLSLLQKQQHNHKEDVDPRFQDLSDSHSHHGHGSHGQNEDQYVAMMKEVLYFFKKHLHDWS